MNNLISPTTTRNPARGQTQNPKAAPQPIAGAAQHLAKELASDNPIELFLSIAELITLNYLPHPTFMTMLHDHLPIQSNPFAQLTSARTIDQVLACRHGLEEFLGGNQSWKTSLLQADPAIQKSVPATLIKYFVKAINNNQLPLYMLPREQQEQIVEFAIFLTNFTQSHTAPQQYVKELTPSEALTFLYCLSWHFDVRPISQAISDIRHELALHFIEETSDNIAHLPPDLLDNYRFVEQAIILYSRTAFSLASYRLQNEPHVQKLLGYRTGHISLERPFSQEDTDCPLMAMAAACNDEAELHHISARLRHDRDFVMATACYEPFVLAVCAKEFRNDRELMLWAVNHQPWALEHASDALADDPEIVLAAVTQNGNMLQFASERLKGDPEIVWTAVSQNRNAIQYASTEFHSEHVQKAGEPSSSK